MSTRIKSEVEKSMIQKLLDAQTTPGFQAIFDPDEAEMAGAFVEDAMSEEDALEGAFDMEQEDSEEDGQGDLFSDED